MTSRSRFPWHIVVVALAACGGQTSSPPSENIDAKWRQYCEKESARQMACNSGPASGCADDAPCLQGVLRAGVVDGLTSCLLARACGVNDDACFTMAAASYQSDPVVSDYTTTCLSKHDACKVAGTSFSDDFCANAGLFRADVLEELRTCILGDCASVRSCTDAVGASHGCK
jgi:hypothetical protein